VKLRIAAAVFLVLAVLDGVVAGRAIALLSDHASTQHGLLALHATLRMVIAFEFAYFAAVRPGPRRNARDPLAFVACAVAMLAVVPYSGASSGAPRALLLAGDVLAIAGSTWIFASVLALGRCFSILPEARGLVTHGPYRIVRHPVYLGEIAAMAGLTLASPAVGHVGILVLFVLAQSVRMRMEERALCAAFSEYAAYAARTSRLIPAPRVALGVAFAASLAAAVVVIPAQAGVTSYRRLPAVKRNRPRRGSTALHAPALQSPASGLSVQSMPAFTWGAVAHASAYQFQLSADRRFGALVATGLTHGALETHNTAATLDRAEPDGVYYWRVRAISAAKSAGPWSGARRVVKAWTSAPQPIGPTASTVDWPTQPLVFKWSSVPYAVKYQLTVATDPALANQVIGSAAKPLRTQGTVFTPSAPLTAGTYFWAVTPLDARGHKGRRSQVASFTYAWPSATATSLTDLGPGPNVFEPRFSWAAVPGAAHYEVEVNSAEGFPAGSKWCCAGTTTGNSLAPTRALANNAYYWRVRAVDPLGGAGVWNYGPPFTKAFDAVTPSIPNLTVRDVHGTALAGMPSTDTPVVTWDPVLGASLYEVQVVPYAAGICDWSQVAVHPGVYRTQTATTAWTPLGDASRAGNHIGPAAWPSAQHTSPALPAGGTSYCLRVLARSDNDAQDGQVVSDWTQLNGAGQPAFTYDSPPPPGLRASPFQTPASAYLQPQLASVTPHTPLFTWNRVEGAEGYFVVIARDAGFTQIADIGYTNVPAYAPRLANGAPLSDETTAYYWAVIPSANADGSGVAFDEPQANSPQSFNKSSAPPSPMEPANGAVVSTQPSFRWTAAENARNYRLQVAADPSFGNPLEDVTTDATAFTSTSTYPADTTLYWRVRANDWIGQGLNWSPVQRFVRTLPAPAPSSDNATGGEQIPVLDWSNVLGAIGYELHIDKVNGAALNFSFPAAAATPTEWYGVGVWRWQVRADFPGAIAGQKVTSGYSAPLSFVRTLDPPAGASGVKTRTRLLISWQPDPAAKQYEVEISTNDGFASAVASHRTDSTSWAPSMPLTTAKGRGRLYWRVAAVDGIGNVGSFVSGSFGKPVPVPRCARAKGKTKGRRAGSRCPSGKSRRKHRHRHG
jgi:protein-S-isoprenylcysteine O-methyltransferase Ste14